MDEHRLLEYLRFRFGQKHLQIHNLQNITSGWETEIISFDIEESNGQAQKLVARIYPGSDAVFKAQKESSTMMKLREIGYPVPRVHIVETDESRLGNPFMVMDRIDGGTLDDKLQRNPKRWIQVFFDLFVRLHELDWRKLSPTNRIHLFEDPYFYIKTTLSDIENALKNIDKQEFLPIIDWARDRYNDVPCSKPSIIHGDFHPFNILVDGDEKAYVIDWGAARIADFRSDLAWTLLLSYAYDTRERRDMLLRGYEATLGQKVEQIEYFEVLSTLRRLVDVISSVEGSSNLRPEAVELIKESARHIVRVRDRLEDLTSISIPEVEKFVDDLTK